MKKIDPFSRPALLSAFRGPAFALLPFSVSQSHIDETLEHFFAFLALPAEMKEALTYKHGKKGQRGGRVGYKYSEPTEQDPDGKETVHYHPSAEIRLAKQRKTAPEFDALLTSMRRLYLPAEETIRKVVTALEDVSPGLVKRFFPNGAHPFFHLRCIKYDFFDPSEANEMLACGHYDIGGLTLGIAECGPGQLEVGGDYGKSMIPIAHHPGQGILMGGYNLPNEVPFQGLESTWHHVRRVPGQLLATVARVAIVLFCDSIGNTSPSWKLAHTRRGTPPNEEQLPLFA